jgi:hexulose-6-phosphate isomerase
MKKSINLWAFPYPQRMTLKECLQLAKDAGFDGIELNYDLDNDLSPKSGRSHSESESKARRMSEVWSERRRVREEGAIMTRRLTRRGER